MTEPAAVLARELLAHLSAGAGLGIAVSGGGDSTALLLLAADWARGRGTALRAVTVDHGLRPAAAAEAAGVAALCARIGVAHEVLRWQPDGGRGNLMARARDARAGLIAGWAARQGIAAVALAHTMDDQAETLLLNLARGSGVDGLSAMPAARGEGGILWLRPLLGVRRQALRDWLTARGQGWVEDPSNADRRFARVRMREALPALGLDVPRLAATAARMQAARAVLEAAAAATAARLLRRQAGDLLIDPALLAEPEEIRGRILAHAIGWVGGARVKPRRDDLTRLIARLAAGQGGTLAGALITPGHPIRLTLEPARAARETAAPPGPWAGRWRIHPGATAAEGAPGPCPGAEIRALGPAGLAARPGWRAAGLPRPSALALPGLWQGERLIFAAVIDADGPFRAELDASGMDWPADAH